VASDPLHPTTRLLRIRQQLQSFGDLHGSEIEAVIRDLSEAGLTGLAGRLAAYRELHGTEIGMVLEELDDIARDLAGPEEGPPSAPSSPSATGEADDPAADSPKRAQWLKEQAERQVRPVSRRDFLFPGGRQ
jgi:hypothetical protein